MDYIKVAQTNELKNGEKKTVTLDGKVLLITNIQDTYYAIDNKCPHMGGSLFEGNFNGNNITCPKHGSVFDVRTGKIVENGKIAFIKLKVNDTKAYPTKIEGNDILIGIE
ncbi:MAG: Rieske 2Fe-2S domain-containing protein [Peptostreptococcaceae bacterium]|nr:Rieske 2Fe-2S domain-containing protein [Peptostreptococcaceae bacterium]